MDARIRQYAQMLGNSNHAIAVAWIDPGHKDEAGAISLLSLSFPSGVGPLALDNC
jgi:hypothetical protein